MLTTKEFIQSFEDHFCDVKDHRQQNKIYYPLIEMFFLGIMAISDRAESWEDIEEFGKIHLTTLRKYFPFENGAPSDCTIRRFFTSFDPKVFNKILTKYFAIDLSEKQIAIDGKTLRGSKYQEQKAFHFLNAYVCESGLTLFGQQIDKKKNEISAIPEAIECLDIKGSIVTIDAMGCQKSIAKQIIDKKADYIFGLKENHVKLYHEVQRAFQHDDFGYFTIDAAKTDEKGHGREEVRICRVIKEVSKIKGGEEWPGLASVIEVQRYVTEKGERSESISYYISSSEQSAEAMLKNIRAHWKIESMHWVLDVAFNEDGSGIRKGNAAANMAIIRRFVLNILNMIKTKKETRPRMMLSMGWSPINIERFADKLMSFN
jgi:predicted transposase YbfD/YdcC